MRKNRMKKWIGILLAMCFAAGLLPTTAMATEVTNNPAGNTVDAIAAGDVMNINEGTVTVNNGEINHNKGTVTTHSGTMSFNYATITANSGDVIENRAGGVIADNEGDGFVSYNSGEITVNNGKVYTNYGTIGENKGTVELNIGTVASNSDTVIYNLCGTVNGGIVVHDYIYTIDLSGIANNQDISFSGDDEAAYRLYDKVYVKENAVITIGACTGYKFTDDGIPKITAGIGTITDNGDGTYTLAGVAGNISLSAALAHVPVMDITGVPSAVYAGIDTNLDDNVAVKPEGAYAEIYWEIADPGTTGATIDPYSGILSAAAEGVVKIKATIENGKSETEDFIKEFTITVTDEVKDVYDAYIAVKTALAGDDLNALKTAAEGFGTLLDTYNAFGDAHKSALAEKLGAESGAEAYNVIGVDWTNTDIILQIAELRRDYIVAPNQETESALVAMFKHPAFEDEELMALVRKFIPDIDDVYAKVAGKPIGPTPNVPKTGDNSNIGLWLGLMMIALAGLAACIIEWRRERVN